MARGEIGSKQYSPLVRLWPGSKKTEIGYVHGRDGSHTKRLGVHGICFEDKDRALSGMVIISK